MQKKILLLYLLLPFSLAAQRVVHDWENYVVSLNGRPVSINVDLGYKELAPVAEDSFVVILRLKLRQTDRNGMPKQEEQELLLNLEDRLVEMLARQIGANFAGRFTQRGIREFYFYAPDTLGYNRAVNQAMLPFTTYEWLAQAKKDKSWSNYLEVLYPSVPDMLRIQSRRQFEKLSVQYRSGREPLPIVHFFNFSGRSSLEKFLSLPAVSGYEIIGMPETVNPQTGKLDLVLKKKEFLGPGWVEAVPIQFYRLVLKEGGNYLGWNPA